MELERHTSPDGTLHLLVIQEGDDLTIGFEGSVSHTHGDTLIGEYAAIGEQLAVPIDAVQRYVSDILSNQIKIRVFRRNESIIDIYALPYEVSDDGKYLEDGERLEIRYWSRS